MPVSHFYEDLFCCPGCKIESFFTIPNDQPISLLLYAEKLVEHKGNKIDAKGFKNAYSSNI